MMVMKRGCILLLAVCMVSGYGPIKGGKKHRTTTPFPPELNPVSAENGNSILGEPQLPSAPFPSPGSSSSSSSGSFWWQGNNPFAGTGAGQLPQQPQQPQQPLSPQQPQQPQQPQLPAQPQPQGNPFLSGLKQPCTATNHLCVPKQLCHDGLIVGQKKPIEATEGDCDAATQICCKLVLSSQPGVVTGQFGQTGTVIGQPGISHGQQTITSSGTAPTGFAPGQNIPGYVNKQETDFNPVGQPQQPGFISTVPAQPGQQVIINGPVGHPQQPGIISSPAGHTQTSGLIHGYVGQTQQPGFISGPIGQTQTPGVVYSPSGPTQQPGDQTRQPGIVAGSSGESQQPGVISGSPGIVPSQGIIYGQPQQPGDFSGPTGQTQQPGISVVPSGQPKQPGVFPGHSTTGQQPGIAYVPGGQIQQPGSSFPQNSPQQPGSPQFIGGSSNTNQFYKPVPGSNGVPIGGSIFDGSPVTQNPSEKPYTGPLNTTPYPGCAAALKCVKESFCTADGVMSNFQVILTREQIENKVPLTDCVDPDTGIEGKCCRDPNYKDPWPAGMMMPTGHNDGFKTLPDECSPAGKCIHSYQCGEQNTLRPLKNCRVPLDGASGVCCSSDQTGFQTGQQIQSTGVSSNSQSFTGSAQTQKPLFPGGTGSSLANNPFIFPDGKHSAGGNIPSNVPIQQPQTPGQTQTIFQQVPQNQPTVTQHPSKFQPSQQNIPSIQSPTQPGNQIDVNGQSSLPEFQPQPGSGQTSLPGFQPQPGGGSSVLPGFQPQPGSGPSPLPPTSGPSFLPGTQSQPGSGQSSLPGFQIQPGSGPSSLPGSGPSALPPTIGPSSLPGFQSQPGSGPSSLPGTEHQQNNAQPSLPGIKPLPNNGQFPVPGFTPQPDIFSQTQQTILPGAPEKPGIIQQPTSPIQPQSSVPAATGQGSVVLIQPPRTYPSTPQSTVFYNLTPGKKCGVRRPVSREGLSKTDCGFGEFPWQALIIDNNNQSAVCSGAIVGPKAVVTTAHCVEKLESSDILVKAGVWRLNQNTQPKPVQISSVAAKSVHPKYEGNSLFNDMAVLILNEPFVPDEHVDFICLPETSIVEPQNSCVATGWGKIALQGASRDDILHQVPVQLIPDADCQSSFRSTFLGSYFQLHKSFQCALPMFPDTDLCKVGAGGPVACEPGDGRYVLSGLYSWDLGCSTAVTPTAVSRLDAAWLRAVLNTPVDVLLEEDERRQEAQQQQLEVIDAEDKPGFSQGYGRK